MTLDILVVSDVWPPQFIGGYELGAADVVDRLTRRGHRVTVLTSTYRVPAPVSDGTVHRLLYERMEGGTLSHGALVRESLRTARRGVAARKFLAGARFDLVYVFNLLGVNARVLQDLADTGRPLVAYVSDSWAARWPWCDPLYARWMEPRDYLPTGRKLGLVLARRALRRLGALARVPEHNPIRHAQFVSRYIREISAPRMPLRTQEVIPWGIDVARFAYAERPVEELRRWLYVGQVEEHKGVHTAIEAVRLLRSEGQAVELTIFGRDTTGYAERLKRDVAAQGLGDAVRFAGGRARDRLWEEAGAAGGVLVFPTLWEEPFSITVLEAFACGMPVLSTLTGGTGEIVRHGETATVFSAGSAQHLAAQWRTLVRHPDRARAMARRARAIVAEHLDLEHMVDHLERHLVEVAEGRGSAAAEPFVPRPHPWEPDGLDARAPTRALEPVAGDGGWLASLWGDLAVGGEETTLEAELDSEAALAFPADVPDAVLSNGRFGQFLSGRVLDLGAASPRAQPGTVRVRIAPRPDARPDVCAEPARLPFAAGAFDAVVGTAVSAGPAGRAVLAELRRVLRPGGHLLLRGAQADAVELVREAGFTVVDRAAGSVHHALGRMLWELLRHHPRHRYLASDERVLEWFRTFAGRAGRVSMPSLGEAACIVARREA